MERQASTRSMELRAIRSQVCGSPLPPASGLSVREWFAGLAMMNPTLMSDVAPEHRASEAVRLADELVKALAAPKVPTLESMRAPSEQEMVEWEGHVASQRVKKEKVERETSVDLPSSSRGNLPSSSRGRSPSKHPTLTFNGPGSYPPPAVEHRSAPSKLPNDTRYIIKGDNVPADTFMPIGRMRNDR